jgi:L-xylulokinase
LLTWLVEEEPEAVAGMRWALGCKDWLRYRLTGAIGTDWTEASAGFASIRTQRYDDQAFALFGLHAVEDRVPAADDPLSVAGEVTPEAAAETGLRAGTAVTPGLHDVMASAIGAGSTRPGQVAIVAGTWSINEVIADRPATGAEWVCRSFVEPGRWVAAAWSPASATNLEWFVRELCGAEAHAAEQAGGSPYDVVEREVAPIWDDEATVIFHPFLYGSPHGDEASAGFFGLRGWHGRGHLLRAVMEGVAFNHRTHIEALRFAFPIAEASLTGGATRSSRWAQLFADVLSLPVTIGDARNPGARGAAMCAGVAVGLYPSIHEAAERCCRVVDRLSPDAASAERLERRFRSYHGLVGALEPVWNELA